MANNNCEKERPNIEEVRNEVTDETTDEKQSFYKEPSEDSAFYGLESHFNKDVVFYQNVTVHGKLNYDFTATKIIETNSVVAINTSYFFDDVDFYGDVYIDGNLNAGIITARKKLDVGCGGTTFTADSSTSRVGIGITNPRQTLDVVGSAIVSERVGIGSTAPQQKLDVAGSVKIDETIYDSVNVPGKNGYQLVRDAGGVRWIPLIAEPRPEVPGIGTDGIFVLDEGVPLYPS